MFIWMGEEWAGRLEGVRRFGGLIEKRGGGEGEVGLCRFWGELDNELKWMGFAGVRLSFSRLSDHLNF